MDFDQYQTLSFSRPADGVFEIAMGSPGKLAVADARMHAELASVWRDADRDHETRVILIRGIGKECMESVAESGIVRSESRQDPGVVHRFAKRGFQFTDALNYA